MFVALKTNSQITSKEDQLMLGYDQSIYYKYISIKHFKPSQLNFD